MSTRLIAATIAAPTIPISIRPPRHWALDAPGLRVVGAPEPGPIHVGGPRKWDRSDYGHPSVIGRLDGRPVELRVWRTSPPRCGSAIYHPSGIWVCARVLS